MQTEHCPGHSQISDSTSHQIPSTVEHQLDVGAFYHSSYAYLNPTIASVHHPLGSRRNASGDWKLGGTHHHQQPIIIVTTIKIRMKYSVKLLILYDFIH